jgi:hypothetical protein
MTHHRPAQFIAEHRASVAAATRWAAAQLSAGPAGECPVCAHTSAHHWWGQDGTHCRRCHRSWTGFREIHCCICCAHFSTPANLDLHKVGGRCVPPGDVVDKDGRPKLRIKAGAGGPTWVLAQSRPDIAVTAAGDDPDTARGGDAA